MTGWRKLKADFETSMLGRAVIDADKRCPAVYVREETQVRCYGDAGHVGKHWAYGLVPVGYPDWGRQP